MLPYDLFHFGSLCVLLCLCRILLSKNGMRLHFYAILMNKTAYFITYDKYLFSEKNYKKFEVINGQNIEKHSNFAVFTD